MQNENLIDILSLLILIREEYTLLVLLEFLPSQPVPI